MFQSIFSSKEILCQIAVQFANKNIVTYPIVGELLVCRSSSSALALAVRKKIYHLMLEVDAYDGLLETFAVLCTQARKPRGFDIGHLCYELFDQCKKFTSLRCPYYVTPCFSE